jgi:hypothetical protein
LVIGELAKMKGESSDRSSRSSSNAVELSANNLSQENNETEGFEEQEDDQDVRLRRSPGLLKATPPL